MAKSKSKSRDLTTESVKFALKTLGISSDELLNLFHEAQGSSSDDYKTWVAKEIVKNSEREDNIPLSQYKLKWAQFLSGTVDDFSTASKVSAQVREEVLKQLSGLLKDKKALWVSSGGFEDLTDSVVSMDESTSEEGNLGFEFEFDWANTTSDWVGMVDLYDQLYQVLQGEFLDDETEEDEGTGTSLVIVGELLSTRSGKKTAINTATAKELGVRDANNGEQRLYQLASSWVRSRSEDVDKVILVLHSGVDFFQKANHTVMTEFLNSFKPVGDGVVGEFTSAHLFESAPQYKNQIVTLWESHNDGEEHEPVTLETGGVVYYQENPVPLRELTRRERKGTEDELDFGFDEDDREVPEKGSISEGIVLFVNERTGKACLTADPNAVTVLPWVEEGYSVSYTPETKEETLERVLSSLAVNYVLTLRGYGVLVEVANGIEEHSKLIVGGVVCAVVDEALRERKKMKDSDSDGYSYESAKKLMGILQPLVDKYPLDLSVEGKQLLQAVEKSKDIVGKSYTQSLKVFTADLTRLAESYNLTQLR